ncbi:GntP family permease [Spiractinospora alimapuensis]|uniref:GntP family permease n=1 Tax=Spiractinospora alimapuensis TaxID=2820884 RepID=UPI001F36B11A|nr:GntP family permease [Spiractinospora alimapuensis]QVQ51865.1 GntP family permease [Spiractinospora alimapuensis]
MVLGLTGIALSLILLITLAYRGHSVVAVAPLAALVAILFAGAPVLASYTQIFMPAMGGFIANFFPLFVTGAIFGKLMSLSGFAQDLANWISRALGPNRAILVTVLATALLTYGGVSAWVVVFSIFPIAMALFEKADIPRRLMPAAIALGIFTFATAALPGSPQIHNTIPTLYFGTNTFAAPLLGVVAGVVVFSLGLAWLNWRRTKLRARGESFSDLTDAERRNGGAAHGPDGETGASGGVTRPDGTDRTDVEVGAGPLEESDGEGTAVATRSRTTTDPAPVRSTGTAGRGIVGLLPVLAVVLTNALMTYLILPALDTRYLAEDAYGATDLSAVAGLWSVTSGMVIGIVVIFALKLGSIREFVSGISEGAKNAVLPAATTASEIGYGAVIASIAAFVVIRDGIFAISDNALVTSILSTSGIAAVTGSASGGLTISLETFGEELSVLAADQGISMEVMHRATAMAATGLDSLPHNGAIITLLLVCGLSHRESYKDIGVVTVLVPLVGVAVTAALGLAFGAF